MFLLLATFSVNFYAAPAQLDSINKVDPNFNVQIQTSSYSSKGVGWMLTLPDDKILVSGFFNHFNRQPVGKLIRLTADGLLDTTFNTNVFADDSSIGRTYLQPDGKIIVHGSNLKLNGSNTVLPRLIRLNSDGTYDPTFNYFDNRPTSRIHSLAVYEDGRILLNGDYQATANGNAAYRPLIRINPDGSYDDSFNFTGSLSVPEFTLQNNKPVIVYDNLATSQIIAARLNDDGSFDSSFTPTALENYSVRRIRTAPNEKIVILSDRSLRRLNVNGGYDDEFQTTILPGLGREFYINNDGRVTFAAAISGASIETTIRRVSANGTPDPSFTNYNPVSYAGFAIQSDNEVFIGDTASTPSVGGIPPNNYVHLLETGVLDTAFNAGNSGFQMINPGSIAAIAVQTDQKILMAGKFDMINETSRSKIARLNADNTVDSSFQINTGASGNRFINISQIYSLVLQSDGKIIVSGSFEYVLNGATKTNITRLNNDGSIDSTFNLGTIFPDLYTTNRAGMNKPAMQSNGKIIIAASHYANSSTLVPSRLNSNGSLDTTLNPNFYAVSSYVYAYDVAILPNQKILICGLILDVDVPTGFAVRLNADGSLDQSFQRIEESGKVFSGLIPLTDGKIIITKSSYPYFMVSQTTVSRFNADGSPDPTFAAGVGANGIVNAMLPLPNGQILIGGNFTTFKGQARQNLVLINSDGSLDSTTFNVNQEVLSLAIDNQERILVGGSFTTINLGDGNHTRSYLARLTNSTRARFDFDGDGRADLGIFDSLTGNWSILNSQANQISNTQFGQNGDRTAAADFDGDEKTDLAVYRPAQGVWYLSRTTDGFAAVQWGASEDRPVPADYDGDGKADIAVWRPSNGVWYIRRNVGNPIYHQFGASGDIPVPADFDGDGKTDVAVFRPSNGTFYWLASGSNNQLKGVQFGQTDDIPTIADYNGDGKDDLTVFRPSAGVWYQYLTTQSDSYLFKAQQFGQTGDEPIAADYDGDGRADIAVRRQGVWHILKSDQGYSSISFGGANTQAVAALPNQ